MESSKQDHQQQNGVLPRSRKASMPARGTSSDQDFVSADVNEVLEDARQILTNKQQRKGEHPNERVLDESTRVKVTKTGGDEDPLEVSVWRTRLVKRREVDEEEQRRLEEDRGWSSDTDLATRARVPSIHKCAHRKVGSIGSIRAVTEEETTNERHTSVKYRRKHQDDMWRREEEADKEEQEGERPYEEKVAEDNAQLTVEIFGSHQQSSSSQPFLSPPSLPFVESSFVTPGIFRRKVSRHKRIDCKDNDKENKETTAPQFQWSIDQMSIMRPVEFDESELSLPPEDWDPSAEFSRSHASAIDQFWTRNTHIAPSPDVLAAATAAHARQNGLCSPEIPSIVNGVNPSLSGSGPSTSSRCSSSIISSSYMMSPMMMLSRSQMFESTRANNMGEKLTSIDPKLLIEDGSDDFEQLERSFSFEVADSIVADMDDGEFVLKNEAELAILREDNFFSTRMCQKRRLKPKFGIEICSDSVAMNRR